MSMYGKSREQMEREEAEQFRRAEEFRRAIHPIVCLPMMRLPAKPVEKDNADYMRGLLEKTCAELRLKPNG